MNTAQTHSRFHKRFAAILPVLILLAACKHDTSQPAATVAPTPPPPPAPVQRIQDRAQIARGEQLYKQYCASCHLEGGAGHPEWRQRGADGKFRAPPLNGTAHEWHHPTAQLRHVIKNGGPPGQSDMPAWGGILTDQQIDDIIAWFQSLWSDEIYAHWYAIDQRAQDYLKNKSN